MRLCFRIHGESYTLFFCVHRYPTFDNEEDTSRDDEKVDDRLHKVAPVPCHRHMLLRKCPRRQLFVLRVEQDISKSLVNHKQTTQTFKPPMRYRKG
jgi:hypothetical protein